MLKVTSAGGFVEKKPNIISICGKQFVFLTGLLFIFGVFKYIRMICLLLLLKNE